MPDLASIADSEALDNRYARKFIVYVEGPEDEAILSRIMGPDNADRLEFKVPLKAGSGHGVVVDRVREERPSNARVFGLIDGEAAAVFGYLDRLLDCDTPIFVVADPGLDGIVFLGEHEIDNLLLRHSALVDFLCNHRPVARLATVDPAQIEATLAEIARRFMLAAYLKYASSCLSSADASVSPLNVDTFRGNNTARLLIKDARARFGPRHPELIQRLLQIAKRIRARVRTGLSLTEERARLADGKGMRTRILAKFSLERSNDGHLLDRVRTSRFAGDFRTALLAHVEQP